MKCPTCPDSTLVMTDRSGVEIDYCAVCRGVCLDRAALDEMSTLGAAPPPRGTIRARSVPMLGPSCGQAQPSSCIAIPECQIFVIPTILSPSN